MQKKSTAGDGGNNPLIVTSRIGTEPEWGAFLGADYSAVFYHFSNRQCGGDMGVVTNVFRASIVALMALSAEASNAGDFATCVLDKMPGVQSDVAAAAIRQVCIAKYPDGINAVRQGSGRGWFGYDSGAECTAKLASETRSPVAARMIFYVCRKLYEPPNPFDTFDPK